MFELKCHRCQPTTSDRYYGGIFFKFLKLHLRFATVLMHTNKKLLMKRKRMQNVEVFLSGIPFIEDVTPWVGGGGSGTCVTGWRGVRELRDVTEITIILFAPDRHKPRSPCSWCANWAKQRAKRASNVTSLRAKRNRAKSKNNVTVQPGGAPQPRCVKQFSSRECLPTFSAQTS